jgi:serine/threonine-protein kinase
VAGTDGASNPFFSPDGAWVGFFADGKLKKTALDGGTPVVLADVRAPRGEAWGPDNTIFFTPVNTSPIMKVSANGNTTQGVTTLAEGEFSHRWPQILPGGKAVLFAIWNDAGWELAHIAVENLETHVRKILVQGGGYGRYVEAGSGEGYLIYARAEGLMAAPFDLARLDLTGPSVPVVDGVITNLSGGAHFSVAGNGTLAYVRGSVGEADRDLVWTGLDGVTKGPIRMKNNGQTFQLSPDGTRILRNNVTGPSRDLWIDNFVRGTTTRVTSQGNNYSPIWSRDAQWVTYGKDLPAPNLFRRPVEGGEAEERLTTSANGQSAGGWSPDGRTLVYTEFDPVSGSDIWLLTLGAKPRPFLQTRFNEGNPMISPDGRSLAYQSNESGRFEIYVRSFPDGEKRWQLSLDGGIVPMWSPTGRDLFFRSTGNQMMAASITAGGGSEWTKPRALFDARPYEDRYSVSPDGQRFLMMPHLALDAAPTQVNLVLNWVSELKQRVHRQ